MRKRILGVVCLATLVLVPIANAKTDPTQKEARQLLKELKKRSASPAPWYKLSQFAYRNKAYYSSVEAALIARDRLPEQKYSRKSKHYVDASKIDSMLLRAAISEAKQIAAGRDRSAIGFRLQSSPYTRASLQSLRRQFEKGKAPKKLKKYQWFRKNVDTPDNNSEVYAEFLTAQILHYEGLGLNQPADLLQDAMYSYQKDKAEYELASELGENDLPHLLSFAKDRKNRFSRVARSRFARIVVKSAIERSKRERGTRSALHELLVWRNRLDYNSSFDAVAEELGIDYLDEISFTSRDILMNLKVLLESTDMWVLGRVRTYGFFASVAKKGEMVLTSGSWLRGFATHTNIKRRPVLRTGRRNYEGYYQADEIWGDFSDFRREKRVSKYQMFTDQPPARLPDRYSPLSLVSKDTDVSGGILGGIADFIEDHPVASALIAGTAVYMMSNSTSESSSSRSSYSPPPRRNVGVGNLHLISGSWCGEGDIFVKEKFTGQKKELDCCGWGNLGQKSYYLLTGTWELSFDLKTCGGKRYSGSGVTFEVQDKRTTTVDLNLSSGHYLTRYE